MNEFGQIFNDKARALGEVDRKAEEDRMNAERFKTESFASSQQWIAEGKILNDRRITLFNCVKNTVLYPAMNSLASFMNENEGEVYKHWTVQKVDGVTGFKQTNRIPRGEEVEEYVSEHEARYNGILLSRMQSYHDDVIKQSGLFSSLKYQRYYIFQNFFAGQIETAVQHEKVGNIRPLQYVYVVLNSHQSTNYRDKDNIRNIMSRVTVDFKFPGHTSSINIFDYDEVIEANGIENLIRGINDANSQTYKDTAQRLGIGLANFAAENISDFPRK